MSVIHARGAEHIPRCARSRDRKYLRESRIEKAPKVAAFQIIVRHTFEILPTPSDMSLLRITFLKIHAVWRIGEDNISFRPIQDEFAIGQTITAHKPMLAKLPNLAAFHAPFLA